MYLLDTNTIIYYLNASLPSTAMQFMHGVVDAHCNISVIAKIETLSFNFATSAEQKIMEGFIAGATILGIDDEIANKTIAIRKLKKIKLPDAIIAATALVYNFTLISRNVPDFNSIDKLNIINPFDK